MDDDLILISSEEEVLEQENLNQALNEWDLEEEKKEIENYAAAYYDSIKRDIEDLNYYENT